jgi:hypothetical protein
LRVSQLGIKSNWQTVKEEKQKEIIYVLGVGEVVIKAWR